MEDHVTTTSRAYWSQVGLNEYSLVAFPDDRVIEKVRREKEVFNDEYGRETGTNAKPQITVASFFAREAMEETMFRYMQRILSQKESFEVSLNNYSGFPPDKIFLRVQNQTPFRQLATQLTVVGNYIDTCSCPPAKLISNAHISISNRLPETVYLAAMLHYSQKTFYETFMVNELVLLRRSNEYETEKPVRIFRLQPPGYKAFANTLFN